MQPLVHALRRFLVPAALCSLVFTALPSAGTAATPGELPTLANLRGLAGISDAAISPDGTLVAYVLTTHDYVADRTITTLMLVRTTGGAPVAMTNGKARIGSVTWSPDGKRLGYISADAAKIDQLYALSIGGGTARALTAAKSDVQSYAWSPDGTHIAYVAEDTPADPVAFARHDDLFDVHDDGFLTATKPLPSHLWITGGDGGAARRLTHGTWSVLANAAPFVGGPSAPSWSADGATIAFARAANADDSDTDRSTIALADVRSGNVRALTTRAQYEYQPLFAPRGASVAYIYPVGPGPISAMNVFLSSGRGAGTSISKALDRDVTGALWRPDGRALYLSANDGIGGGIWVQPIAGTARKLALGALIPSEFSVAKSGAIALVASDATHPSEVFVMTSASSTPRKLTNHNAAIAQLRQGRSVRLTWTAADGERSDGVLTYPAGYTPRRKYPLVLRIHGGPEGSSSLAYTTGRGAPFRVMAAARGYLTFEPNYRGSDNLGTAHEHAIYGDPGAGPWADVTAGIDAVEKLGVVDTSRICVTGHSYGGYMTAWAIGHDARWACAIVSDGVVDARQEYELSSDGNLAFTRDSYGGTPADPAVATLYHDGSPISYVDAMKTPTLIFSGTNDATVPITQSFELYHALRDRKIPVRFVAIPTAHHFPSDPVRIESYWRTTFAWLDHYLK